MDSILLKLTFNLVKNGYIIIKKLSKFLLNEIKYVSNLNAK